MTSTVSPGFETVGRRLTGTLAVPGDPAGVCAPFNPRVTC